METCDVNETLQLHYETTNTDYTISFGQMQQKPVVEYEMNAKYYRQIKLKEPKTNDHKPIYVQ